MSKQKTLVFADFKIAVAQQFDRMKQDAESSGEFALYRTAITKDRLWEVYLGGFPEGSNPLCKERTEHDCQACRQFIRAVGDVVSIVGDRLVSLWDIELDGPYKDVAEAMSTAVKGYPISDVLLHDCRKVGVDKNHSQLESGEIITWEHFSIELPKRCVKKKDDIPTLLGCFRTKTEVFLRALREITTDALDTVLELIEQNSLYHRQEEGRRA